MEHYHLAGLDECAHPYALQEAQRASQVGAFREEYSYLEIALNGLAEKSPERLHLLERLGLVSMGIHDFSAALHWLSLAKMGYQHIGQSSHVLRVLGLMILPAWFLASHELSELLVEIENSIETDFAHTDHTHRDINLLEVSSLFTAYQVTNCYFYRVNRLAERNNDLFELLINPRKVAVTQTNYIACCEAKMHQHIMLVKESIAELRQILRIAHQYGLPHVIMFGYWVLTGNLTFVGRLEEAKQVMEETIEYEQYSGVLRVSYLIGWIYFFSGEQWEQGIELLRNSIQKMKQANILAPVAIEGVILAHLLLARNELSEALAYLHIAQPILERMNENRFLFWLGWGLAKLHAVQGNLLQAEEWYERVLERWKTTEDTLFILPILKDGVAFYAQIGNLAQARVWLAELQTVVKATENPVGMAALLETQGILAAKQKIFHLALDGLRQAVHAWEALKFHYHQALVTHYLAELLLQQSKQKTINHKTRREMREEAEALLQQVSLIYERLDIAGQREAIQRLRAQTRLDAQRKRRRTIETHRQAAGLTPRELQTLHLLAAGKMNKEIARTLGISIGTVELHVTHILTKLNCENRTQAVVCAVSKGWITTSS